MSRENVELVRRYLDSLRRRDFETAIALWHPDCEWHPQAAAFVEGDAYRGHDGLRRYFAMLTDVMESVEMDVDGIREVDERAVVLGRLWARGRGSGVQVEEELGLVFEFSERLILRGTSYRDRAKALEAVGLRE
jgi:ketosteroid isomerase-like protein